MDELMSKKLGETDLTVAWLVDSLRKNDEEYHKVVGRDKDPKEVECVNIGAGKGLFSIVLKITLTFDSLTYTTIVKIPGLYVFEKLQKGDKDSHVVMNDSRRDNLVVPMHANECIFYEKIARLIPETVPRVFASREWLPYEKQLGYLHMENLADSGKTVEYYDSLTHGQIKDVVRHLAGFHKVLLTLDRKEWTGHLTEMGRVMRASVKFIQMYVDKFQKFVRNKAMYQPFFDDKKFMKLLFNAEFIDYAYQQSYLDIGLPTLIAHGDIWGSNILFESDLHGNPTDKVKAILDWQIAHEGNFLIDFVRLFILSCDGQIRREAELYIFDFYVECLQKELDEGGASQKVPFTAEQLREAYDWLFLAHSQHHFIVYPTVFGYRTVPPGEEKAEDARKDKCELKGVNIFEDVVRLLETGKYDKWL